MEKTIPLTKDEAEFLNRPVNCKRPGGFQRLLLSLQGRMYLSGRRWFLRVDRQVAERVVRYAGIEASHNGGGYQRRLRPIAEKARPVLTDVRFSQLPLPLG